MSALAQVSVARTAGSSGANGAALLRRKCACGTHTISGQQCGSCAERERSGHKQRDASPGSSIQPVVHDVLQSPGVPLDSNVAAAMGAHIGRDFSGVRVHNDARAADAARSLDALAFTAGRDIVFGAGQYNPASPRGRHILGHELAHVAQQGGSNGRLRANSAVLQIGNASDPAEAEADRVADALTTDKPIPSVSPRAPALRRQTAGNQPTSAQTGSTRPEPQFVSNVDLGRMSRFYNGQADAVLHRGQASAQSGGKQPPCELELFLKLHFDFHLGPSPYRQGPMGSMTQPGPPWPPQRAEAWKRQYMQVAQATWHTYSTLERSGDCTNEPCTAASGRLRVVDADAMTDSSGNHVSVQGMTSAPHFNVNVYEYRPMAGKDESRVGGSDSTLYAEDVQPHGTPAPQGFDSSQYNWRPGAAGHETGHMLGRPHVNCAPDDTGNQNREECYGTTPDQRANVMGRGDQVSKDDHAPFLAGMRATTQCEWKVAGGLSGWAIFGIVLGSVALTAGIVGGIAYGVSKSSGH